MPRCSNPRDDLLHVCAQRVVAGIHQHQGLRLGSVCACPVGDVRVAGSKGLYSTSNLDPVLAPHASQQRFTNPANTLREPG